MFYEEITDLHIISYIFCQLNDEEIKKKTIFEPTEQENKTKFRSIYCEKKMINNKAK